MILRTIFQCRPCAANAQATGIVSRVVIDSVDNASITLLGCPICASHDLHVENMARLDEPAAASPGAPADAPPAVEPITPPAPEPPPPALPSPAPANDNAKPPGAIVAPVVATSEEDAKRLEANGQKADFIQLPTRVRCTAEGCEAALTFDVKERMTDALARERWSSSPRAGTRCPKHREEEAKEDPSGAAATN